MVAHYDSLHLDSLEQAVDLIFGIEYGFKEIKEYYSGFKFKVIRLFAKPGMREEDMSMLDSYINKLGSNSLVGLLKPKLAAGDFAPHPLYNKVNKLKSEIFAYKLTFSNGMPLFEQFARR